MTRRLIPTAWLLVVSAFFLAGCVGSDAPTPEPADPVPPAGDPGPVDGGAADAGTDGAAAPRVRTPVPVAADGLTSQGVWACTSADGTGGCVGEELSDSAYHVAVALGAPLAGGNLTLGWAPLDPTLQTMVVLWGVHGDGSASGLGRLEATSPVTLPFDGAPDGADGVYVAIWPAAEAKTPAGAVFVDVQRQPFSIAGELDVWATD